MMDSITINIATIFMNAEMDKECFECLLGTFYFINAQLHFWG